MNISYNWLKDLVETDLDPQEMAEKLTKVGLAVEGIHPHGDDLVFDIDLTSNRGDCLSHLGVAREISAIADCGLRVADLEESKPKTENQELVSIRDPEICHRFTARIIRNVKIGPSPEWLVKRLEAVGERSINNVADVTNFVMHELGNPMHSFDFNNLAGNRIIVRRAKTGEVIKTLDEVERNLNEQMLVICDAERPLAVGGVMGGIDSGITQKTTDVLLEVAYFRRDSIRRTSRELKLSTEASHRFERGVDIENVVLASNRATSLIVELTGGEPGEFVDVYPTKQEEIAVKLRYEKIRTLTGLDVTNDETDRILGKLGFKSRSGDTNSRTFAVPTWRHDIAIEQDLVEEVARHVGYDRIGADLPPTFGAGEYQPNEMRKFHLRQTLANLGFDEAISYSFIDKKNDETFELIPRLIDEKTDEKLVTLRDSIIDGAVRMRPGLLSGLLDAVRTNFNHQRKDIKLFELGKVFANSSNESGLPKEQEVLGLVMTGGEILEGKSMSARELDFFDAKGALEAAMNSINLPVLEFKASNIKHLRKGQSAEVSLNGKTVGSIGRLNDEISDNYKFKQPVYVAEVDLQTLLAEKENVVFYKPLPKYPAIVRDVSLLVKRSTSFAEIIQAVENNGFELCRNVTFVDVYEGKGMLDDERSVTIRLEYRSDERTLTEADVEEVHAKILSEIESKLGAKQRF